MNKTEIAIDKAIGIADEISAILKLLKQQYPHIKHLIEYLSED